MPAVHGVHAPAPLVALNDPSAHSSHVLCPAAAWNVPGLHGVWSAAPVEQDEPTGQITQSSALVIEMLSAVSVVF